MKFIDLEIKSLDPAGVLAGFASTYNNVDRQNDMVLPGAFTKTIAESGGRVPLLWQHNSADPIGLATLEDSPRGLLLRAQLDLDCESGRRAYSAIKKGIVSALSIGYETVRASLKNGVNQLHELKLWEVSVVTIPANAEAAITSVKRNHDEVSPGLRQMVAGLAAGLDMLTVTTEMKRLARTMGEN